MGADFSYSRTNPDAARDEDKYGNCISCFRSSSLAFGGGKAICGAGDGIYVDSNSDAELSSSDFSYAGITYTEEGGVITPVAAIPGINGAGIEVGPACKVQAGGAKANYCKRGIYAYNGANVTGREFTSVGCKRTTGADGGMSIHCQSGSRVSLPSSVINQCQYAEVLAENGGDVCVNGANANQTVGCCVVARGGSKIQCVNANCQRGASQSSSDIQCDTGSIIQATGATGGTSLTPNTIASTGLIIK
jgi:hypothetical protein